MTSGYERFGRDWPSVPPQILQQRLMKGGFAVEGLENLLKNTPKNVPPKANGPQQPLEGKKTNPNFPDKPFDPMANPIK